jgi:catechol 2,3-dioxygenase-like lactoylglutathione lyase family enzyme
MSCYASFDPKDITMDKSDVLRIAPEFPESSRPSHVHKVVRPVALNKAIQLAFLRFEKKDLKKAEDFWNDFGLQSVSHTDEMLVMRGTGSSPAILVAYRGERSRFIGAAFVVPDSTDFEKLQRDYGAEPLLASAIPGGGRGISLRDPSGNEVWLIADWGKVDPIPLRVPLTAQMNSLEQRPRVNSTIRPPLEPARVARLGHLVLQTTDFQSMATWYMRHLGVIPTDVQYLEDGSTMLAFFRLDLGDTPAEHHSIVVAGALENRYEHSAWEVADLDAIGQGHQILKSKGHKHMWGIGRHVLGSQLFDYWYDADGFEFEHYTDSDLFTADYETRYVPFSAASIWSWGHDVPATMFPKKSVHMLAKAIRGLLSGQVTLERLKLMASAVEAPARPWLR